MFLLRPLDVDCLVGGLGLQARGGVREKAPMVGRHLWDLDSRRLGDEETHRIGFVPQLDRGTTVSWGHRGPRPCPLGLRPVALLVDAYDGEEEEEEEASPEVALRGHLC